MTESGCQIKFVMDRKTVVIEKLPCLAVENHSPYFTLLSRFLHYWDFKRQCAGGK